MNTVYVLEYMSDEREKISDMRNNRVVGVYSNQQAAIDHVLGAISLETDGICAPRWNEIIRNEFWVHSYESRAFEIKVWKVTDTSYMRDMANIVKPNHEMKDKEGWTTVWSNKPDATIAQLS